MKRTDKTTSDAMVKMVEGFKAAGLDRDGCRAAIRARIGEIAGEERWREAELAMALAGWDEKITQVYGDRRRPESAGRRRREANTRRAAQ